MVKDEILKLFYEEENACYSLKNINKKITHLNYTEKEIEKTIYDLRLEGLLFYDDNLNQYRLFPNEYKIGTIELSKKGFYTIVIDDSRYGIKKDKLNSALNHDIVVVKDGLQYEVVQILKRNTKVIVCEVRLNENNNKVLVPIKIGHTFKVDIGTKNMKKLLEGQVVSVKIGTEKFDDAYEGNLLEVIGHKTDPDIHLKSIAIANGFNPNHNKDTLEQVKSIPLEVRPEEIKGRLDLREENIFTIDGEQTKDLDDAVSIKVDKNGNYVLGVHIADVAYYVKFGTPIFNEAAERGNSLYMLNTVIPMLPRELSNGICSLNEGVDRLTRSVFITFDKQGNILDFKKYKSVINSKKKMTKEAVNEILENEVIVPGYEPFIDDLKLMNELCNVLEIQKEKRGYVNFASEEPEFEYDENNNPINISKMIQRNAEKMIEDFMVAHNSVIPEEYYWQKLPFVYRNHGIPDTDKVYDAVKLLKNIGYKVNTLRNLQDPFAIQALLKNLTNKEEFPVLSTLILRSMQKAYYDIYNIGHFGLSLAFYYHGTSPIRRLADLIDQLLMDMYDEGIIPSPELMNELSRLCKVASMQERNADIAEYQAYKYACIQIMADNIGKEYEAFITDITPKKVIIKLTDGIEGMIDLYKLGVLYQYKEENKAIFVKGIEPFLIGKKINVILKETSMENLELYFTTNELIKETELTKKRVL